MDELLKEFWAAYKLWNRITTDMATYPGGHTSQGERERHAWKLDHAADRLYEFERAQATALPAGAHEDIPGQMYLTDLPAGSLAVDASQRGAA